MRRVVEGVGATVLRVLTATGSMARLLGQVLRLSLKPPLRWRLWVTQMERVGVDSLPVVILTATFTGMVLALQSYDGFARFGAEGMVGTVVSLSMTRELGPVLVGLMVAGRVGASMAAELGTMRVTEQIDALYTLATHPVHYLIVPRFWACVVMLPALVVLADGIGIGGGFLVSVLWLDTNPVKYMERTWQYLELFDLYSGLIKAALFGGIVAWVGCHQGFFAGGGAEGVGLATTRAVVTASILILLANTMVTALFF